jgi:hypothetical protein
MPTRALSFAAFSRSRSAPPCSPLRSISAAFSLLCSLPRVLYARALFRRVLLRRVVLRHIISTTFSPPRSRTARILCLPTCLRYALSFALSLMRALSDVSCSLRCALYTTFPPTHSLIFIIYRVFSSAPSFPLRSLTSIPHPRFLSLPFPPHFLSRLPFFLSLHSPPLSSLRIPSKERRSATGILRILRCVAAVHSSEALARA